VDARLFRCSENQSLLRDQRRRKFFAPELAPGKYTITAWQEEYGPMTQDVTITGDETQNVDFTFRAKPY
jgi:hypothetical protein